MQYLKVRWIHGNDDYPIWLYSELDGQLRETRKIELFANRTSGFADREEEGGGTLLSVELLPPIAEIAADPQFVPEFIGVDEFERIWGRFGKNKFGTHKATEGHTMPDPRRKKITVQIEAKAKKVAVPKQQSELKPAKTVDQR